MKKLYTLVSLALLLIGGKAFSQAFTYTNIDLAKSGNPGDELILASELINSTSSTLSLRVTRQQDVMPDAPTWTSAFCMDVCYLPTTDSVNYTFAPMDTVEFTFHMYTSSTPDHAVAKMRWKNVNNSSNVFNQDFFGATDGSSGISELSNHTAQVHIYPMPVTSGEAFAMNVSYTKDKSISMNIYDVLGNKVAEKNVIAGINLLDVNLSAGVYSYSLIAGNSVINSGKIAVAK